ncbi:MAG: SecDF P1 head subdomain-containing protein [Magnetospiraceae bacterium]
MRIATLIVAAAFGFGVLTAPAGAQEKTCAVQLTFSVQGGVELTSELTGLEAKIRRVLRAEGIAFRGLQTERNHISLRVLDPSQAEAAAKALQGMDRFGLETDFKFTGLVTVALSRSNQARYDRAAVEQVVETVDRRIQALEMQGVTVLPLDSSRFKVLVSHVEDSEVVKSRLLSDATASFHWVEDGVTNVYRDQTVDVPLPPQYKRVDYDEDGTESFLIIRSDAIAGGQDIEEASARRNEYGSLTIDITLNWAGARRINQVTQRAVGRRLALVIGNQALSAPVIREPITGASLSVTGDLPEDKMDEVIATLNAGRLTTPLRLDSEELSDDCGN